MAVIELREIGEECAGGARLKVLGVGGCGCNAINRMIQSNLKGVEYVAINTDVQALYRCLADVQIQIGPRMTRGLGAGGNCEVGEQSAEENIKEIEEVTTKQRQRVRKLEGEANASKADVALLAAYQHEIRTLKRKISQDEEEGLRLVEKVDQLDGAASELEATLEEERGVFAEFRGNVENPSVRNTWELRVPPVKGPHSGLLEIQQVPTPEATSSSKRKKRRRPNPKRRPRSGSSGTSGTWTGSTISSCARARPSGSRTPPTPITSTGWRPGRPSIGMSRPADGECSIRPNGSLTR